MKWIVYIDDYHTRKNISTYNIFDHRGFKEGCDKVWKKYKDNREKFEEHIKTELAYYFWSKCEWEIILSGWPPHKDFKDKKVDVYSQVMLNWDVFIDYLWSEYNGDSRRK